MVRMNNNSNLNTKDANYALDIKTSNLEDGTKIIKMGNNTYEFPIMTAPMVYKAANRR